MKPFEQLVTDHGALVLRVCRVLLGPADAEDAWSETFLAALRGYPELPAGANTEAWLVTIAHRKSIDALRRRDRLPVPMPADLLPDRPGARRSGPGSDGPGSDDDGLWQYVAALPLRQREAIAYHYLAGLPYKEAAALTGSTPAAMRRAAADGIRKLRNIYALEGAL
jgi:RNA polymerase sigma factor (sigma-70 family)